MSKSVKSAKLTLIAELKKSGKVYPTTFCSQYGIDRLTFQGAWHQLKRDGLAIDRGTYQVVTEKGLLETHLVIAATQRLLRSAR